MWDTDYFSEGSLYEMSQSQSEGTTSDQVLNKPLRGVVAKNTLQFGKVPGEGRGWVKSKKSQFQFGNFEDPSGVVSIFQKCFNNKLLLFKPI